MLICVCWLNCASCWHQSVLHCFLPTDNWTIKCIYTTKIIRRIPRCVSKHCRRFTTRAARIISSSWMSVWVLLFLFCQVFSDGADGCQPVPGHSDGAGPREAFLSPLSDAVWYKTPPCCGHHSQGKHQLATTIQANFNQFVNAPTDKCWELALGLKHRRVQTFISERQI